MDDVFPHPLSAFRFAEYNRYLVAFPESKVLSTAAAFGLLGETRPFDAVLSDYGKRYPQFAPRVHQFDAAVPLDADLAYFMFINNAVTFLNHIEQACVPFLLTLYPGGGLALNDEASDNKLRSVFSSPYFRRVIVTQNITQRYLLDHEFCRPEQVTFIYGGVHPSDHLTSVGSARLQYGRDKDTFDICFVAQKYTEGGKDKGFDVFIEAAKKLARMHEDVRFHVVGSFTEADADMSHIRSKVTFYGTRPTGFFSAFYAAMDAIVSPNVPFVLSPGAFDGFPTGACVEAGLCGVPVFCTDPLQMNVSLRDGKEIVLIKHDAEDICAKLERYYSDYPSLCSLGRTGQQAFRRIYDISAQMAPRLAIIASELNRLH